MLPVLLVVLLAATMVEPLMDFTVTYLSEAREGEVVDLSYALSPDGKMRLEATEHSSGHRVFAIEGIYG